MLARLLARLSGRSTPPRPPIELRLYTRAQCPLCDQMKAVLARARVRPAFRLLEIDVDGDPELLARHGRAVPVLEIAGRVAFKGRLEPAEFERKYARRVAELAAEGSRARVEGEHA